MKLSRIYDSVMGREVALVVLAKADYDSAMADVPASQVPTHIDGAPVICARVRRSFFLQRDPDMVVAIHML
jgi:hypothetical protein